MGFLYYTCHVKYIFADLFQISHIYYYFCNCCQPPIFDLFLTRYKIPRTYHIKPHRNFKKYSENGLIYRHWLRNVLRATTARTFFDNWTSKNSPTLRYLAHITSNFLVPQRRAIFHRALIFDPPEFPKYWKKTMDPHPPRRISASSFFWLFLFFEFLSSSFLFSNFSTSAFSSVHIIGNLISEFILNIYLLSFNI